MAPPHHYQTYIQMLTGTHKDGSLDTCRQTEQAGKLEIIKKLPNGKELHKYPGSVICKLIYNTVLLVIRYLLLLPFLCVEFLNLI
jgi:hypothetical protein